MVFRETGTRLTAVRLAMSTPLSPHPSDAEQIAIESAAARKLLPWNHPLMLGSVHTAVEVLQRMAAERDPIALALGRIFWRDPFTDDELIGKMGLMACRRIVARVRGSSDWKRYLWLQDQDDDLSGHYLVDSDD